MFKEKTIFQTDAQKIGEIQFRKDLYIQQVTGKKLLEDEFNTEDITSILQGKVRRSIKDFGILFRNHGKLEPFLEICAERCQRSSAIMNYFNIRGLAIDISYHSLKSAVFYSSKLNLKKIPTRVCCDVYNLPFRDNVFPLVFCAQSLHHFESLAPVVKEIERVCSSIFFITEEPIKRQIKLVLGKKKNKIYHPLELKKNEWKIFFEETFLRRNCNEVDYGILENDEISFYTWRKELSKYFNCNWFLGRESLPNNLTEDIYCISYFMKFIWCNLFGGSLTAVCHKKNSVSSHSDNVNCNLVCPVCIKINKEIPDLEMHKGSLTCCMCHTAYPVYDDIMFLLTPDQIAKYYHDL